MAAQRRGSVEVFVHPPNDSLEAMATLFPVVSLMVAPTTATSSIRPGVLAAMATRVCPGSPGQTRAVEEKDTPGSDAAAREPAARLMHGHFRSLVLIRALVDALVLAVVAELRVVVPARHLGCCPPFVGELRPADGSDGTPGLTLG